MRLESFVSNNWQTGTGEGRSLVNPVSGETIAMADCTGIDFAKTTAYAHSVGVAELVKLSFAQRGELLKSIAGVLQDNREKYGEIARTNSGNTQMDAAVDIDGGIGTLKYYSRLAKQLGDATRLIEDERDQLARDPVFFAQHVWSTRPGIAFQINAYNFPSWGMWEKFSIALLAGVPSIIKPATATALLSHEMTRDVVAANVLPDGVLSLVCGSGNALLEHVAPMDSVAFTGSSDTGQLIAGQMASRAVGARLNIEADSVNATIIGPDVKPGTDLFDIAVREVGKALQVKAGQLCTNIRRVFVHSDNMAAFSEALAARVAKMTVGDPADEATRVGPLVNLTQRRDAEEKIAILMQECRQIAQAPLGEQAEASAFVAPIVLQCTDLASAHHVHETEVFGPCATLMAYDSVDRAASLANASGGALAISLFSNDDSVQDGVASAVLPWHGRLMLVDDTIGKAHTGHAIVMPQCVHGGPGRAGGGEELGGLRGLRFHMQRSAVQGCPAMLDRLSAHAAPARL